MYTRNLVSYHQLFENAPMATAILHSGSLKLEMANQKMLTLWDRPQEIIGSALLDFLPEMAAQRYPEYLAKVSRTGTPIEETGASVQFNRSGRQEHVFMDYSYTPIFGEHGRVNAILVLATDVSEREINKLIAMQGIRDLRAMVLSAPMAMCVYRGADLKLEVINEHMLDLWHRNSKVDFSALAHVMNHGVPYKMFQDGISYTFTPIGAGLQGVSGVCVFAVKTT